MADKQPLTMYQREFTRIAQERIDGGAALDLVEFGQEMHQALLRNPDMLAEFLADRTAMLAYQIGANLVGQTRNRRGLILYQNSVTTAEAVKQQVKTRVPRWANWREHAGSRSLRFMDMRAADLELAIKERQQRGLTELRTAAFMQRVRQGLGDGQKVSDVYTEDQLDLLANTTDVAIDVIEVAPPPPPPPALDAGTPEAPAAD